MVKPVMHIVRRFGPVGGMEKYVWELTHALLELGVNVEVLCEKVMQTPDPRIRVHVVGPFPEKPRWKSMMLFRAAADKIVREALDSRPVVVHSHERSIHHHVTTFHGPPMVEKDQIWRLSFLSRRVRGWKKMEQDELLGPNVKFILPVSKAVLKSLRALHPEIDRATQIIAWPGVSGGDSSAAKENNSKDTDSLRLLFVGKEWMRKGLDIAVSIAEHMAQRRPVTLDVFGPAPDELPRSLVASRVVNLKGWVDKIPWAEYSALIHPARNEPFGMVVAEARQNGIPALVSSRCGCVEIGFKGISYCPLGSDVSLWLVELEALLSNQLAYCPEELWTWSELSCLHAKQIYPSC